MYQITIWKKNEREERRKKEKIAEGEKKEDDEKEGETYNIILKKWSPLWAFSFCYTEHKLPYI